MSIYLMSVFLNVFVYSHNKPEPGTAETRSWRSSDRFPHNRPGPGHVSPLTQTNDLFLSSYSLNSLICAAGVR